MCSVFFAPVGVIVVSASATLSAPLRRVAVRLREMGRIAVMWRRSIASARRIHVVPLGAQSAAVTLWRGCVGRASLSWLWLGVARVGGGIAGEMVVYPSFSTSSRRVRVCSYCVRTEFVYISSALLSLSSRSSRS